jgi:hypothetical protein
MIVPCLGSRQTSYFSRVHDTNPEMPVLICVICGQPLVGERDDQPDWPTGPMCGNCYQAREMDNDLWMIELNDASSEDQ